MVQVTLGNFIDVLLMRNAFIAILIIAVGGVGWLLGTKFGSSSSTKPLIANKNEKTDIPPTVRCQGKFVPAGGIVKILAPVGEKVEHLLDKQVGQSVAKDEVLVCLFSRNIREHEWKLAKARREDALNKAEYEKQQAAFQKKTAELAVDEAEDSEEKINREAQKIKLIESQHETAVELLDRLEQLKQNPDTKDLINESELSKQRLLVEQLSMQIEQGQMDVELAKQAAARAQKLADNNLKSVKFAIDNAARAIPLQSLDAAVELAKSAYDMTEIKSPIDGKILDIIVRKGDSTTDRPIMIVADTDNMQCLAEVNDSLLQHIVLDENANPRVKITSPAFESAIWGNVVNKGLMISPPSLKNPNPFASVDRRTGTLTIALDDNETAAQFVNLQVEVEVEVIPGSLTQPQQSPAD